MTWDMDAAGWLHLCLAVSATHFVEDRAFSSLETPESCHKSPLRRGSCECGLCSRYRAWWWAVLAVLVQAVAEASARRKYGADPS